MELRWHGHSFFSLAARDGARVLVDPFFHEATTRRAPGGFAPDLVLVTHPHDDHLGAAASFGAPVVAVHETAGILAEEGCETLAVNLGGSLRWRGLRIWCVPALHSAAYERGDASRYGGVACGFVVDDGETRVYHAGDTGLFGDMRTVIGDLLRPHVALLPIGDRYTMGPEHAAVALRWVGARVALPMHYNTFDAIRQDPQDFVRHVGDAARVAVPALDGGVEARGPRVVRDLPPEAPLPAP